MGWGTPYSFLLLLAVFPLIFFLHSLRPRGLKVRTTSLFLWERILKERPMGKRLGRLLKRNLLLILQLLIALILVAALADPSLLHYGAPAGDAVVVLDLSASMKAKGRSGIRFDAARKEFLSLIDGMPRDQKMMVIGAGPIPRVLLPFTTDKKKLRELGHKIGPTDAPAQVKEAILFAHSFLKRGSRDRVVVLSDGAFDGAEGFPWDSPHLRLAGVDGGKENVGIMGFEFRRLAHHRDRYEIMVRIKNFMPRPVHGPLTVTVNERIWIKEDLAIPPQGSRTLIAPYQGPLQGRATAQLAIEDDFPTDNQAFLVLSESPPMRFLYVGRGNPFLEQLFRALPYVQVTRADRWMPEDFAPGLDQYDMIILDGVPSPSITEGNFILINSVAKGLPLEVKGKIPFPRLLPGVTKHPVTEGLRLEDLYIKEALHLVPTGEGKTLVRSTEGPIIFALEKGRLRALVLGFDLLASDLPFRVAFPVLFVNAFDWFHPKRVEFPTVKVQAGRSYELHVPATEDQVEVRAPSGKKETLQAVSNPLPFADTFDAGFYSFRTKTRSGEFAVNLFSENESEISPRIPAISGGATPRGLTKEEKVETGFSLWPFVLILGLVLLAVECLLAYRSGGSFYPLVFRLLTLSGIVFAIVDPRIFRATEGMDVILGADFSRSVGQEGKDAAVRILEEARRLRSPQTRTGLLFFGREPAWEFFPRADFPLADFFPEVGREETDIQAALQGALAQVGEGRQGRILLISDGNENRGETSRVVALLRSHGVPVWVLPVGSSQGTNEIYVSDLMLPRQVDSAESFEIRGAIESLRGASARVKLLRNGVLQRERTVALRGGTNWVSFRESLRDRGSHTYELLVESREDALPENNLLQGVVDVKGAPRVLYLHSQKESQRFFSRALTVQGYSVVNASPEDSSLSLPEIAAFDLLVLDNVPAYRLTQSKMEAIESYVKDLGGGLVVLGGSQSYGAGGYYRTPLERILPVEMRPPSRLDLPHVALLFVVDKSGSMGGGSEGATKLDLAKSAAVAAADLLNPSDQVAILAFDAEWEWVLPFRQVGKGEWISERLSSLQSDGGTDLYKALVEAYRVFSTKPAAIRHILVLSDGLTDKGDFRSLTQRMMREGISVSTVAVGRDADLALMGEIAKTAKGRAYVTADPRTIPQIFTTETLLVSRDLLVEKLIYPRVTGAVGPLKGFSQKRLPSIRGYVLTRPKSRAELLMKAEEDPLLVSWRYGLGSVVAFTSDLSGRWGREWVKWEGFPQWASQVARSAMKRSSEHKVHIEFQAEGNELKAVTDLLSKEGGFINDLELKGILTAPDQATLLRPFYQIAPGRYEASFSVARRGVHFLTIYVEGEKSEGPFALATAPFIAPYPREYRELKPNTTLLSRLGEETGGEVLDPDKIDEGLKRLFTPDPAKATSAQETWWPLSGLSLFLFLADLALRRLPGRFTGAG